MLNQVTIEGFIVSRWDFKGDRFLRIAHHRDRKPGEVIHSDYVTIRLGADAGCPEDLDQGDQVRVSGEVWGKDIFEPLGRVLQKAHLNVKLPAELENLIIPRPTAYIQARQISLVDSKDEAYASAVQVAGRPYRIRLKAVENIQERVEEI